MKLDVSSPIILGFYSKTMWNNYIKTAIGHSTLIWKKFDEIVDETLKGESFR